MSRAAKPRRKWRPSLALVVGLVCLALVSVPVLAFLSMRLSSNQFVRETETSLAHQAAYLSAAYAKAFESAAGGARFGSLLSTAQQAHWAARWHPHTPLLNLRKSTVLPPLPDFEEAPGADVAPPPAPYERLYEDLMAFAQEGQRSSLAGIVFLDHRGINLRPDQRVDLSAAPEVQTALQGRVGAALRDRGGTYGKHPLTSISRDTWYRVFLAHPVIVEDHVIGVVLMSRTPSNFAKFALAEQGGLLGMLGATLAVAALVGALLLRLVLRPVRALGLQSQRVASGHIIEPEPLDHYGIKELADLGESVIEMGKTLSDRSRQVTTYTDHVTHELKSPVTAIMGAAELLSERQIDAPARAKLTANITSETHRMTALLDGLREMTRLRNAPTTGRGPLTEMLPKIEGLSIQIDETSEDILPLLPEHGRIILHQLARNAREHGADLLNFSYRNAQLEVSDNGRGIAPENADQILEPFFTTKRNEGGTGLGLSIVQAVLQNYRANIRFAPCNFGTRLVIAFEGP